MRVLYLDCFCGISGDMVVGALCDLGVDPDVLRDALARVGLRDVDIRVEHEERAGIRGMRFRVEEGSGKSDLSDESHHGSHHVHRTHAEIRRMIGCARLDPAVEERVLGVFRRLAEAEARVHGSGVDEVTFHEVGAFDSIADIVCACEGIHRLGIERVEISPLFEGRGWVECAHGRLPIPAPATLEILRGVELAGVEVPHEFVTPTGAALACEFAHGFGARPALRIDRIGYGVATRCLPEYPGLLRAIVGEADPALGDGFGRDRVAVIETNLDDLTPELAGALVNRVLDAGALDATLVPVQMKKGRPGFRLEVLVAPERAGAVADVVFVESTAFGLRLGEVSRLVLRREWRDVETAHGVVRVKLGWKGARLLQASPEYESCEAVARAAGVPLRAVYEAATRALGDAAGGAGQEVA